MKKNWLLVAVIVVVVLVLGYLGRDRIKAMLGMTPAASPVIQTATDTSSPPSTTASTDNIYTIKADPVKGNYMADFAGMALYTYDKDTAGVSNCYDKCAVAWPPYMSGAASEGSLPANITLVTRTDGTKMFAWKGMPLYYYITDKAAGDVTGDGVGGVWHLVKP